MASEKYYAQYGEDKILNTIFGAKQNGVCIEVGGYDGVTGSNTFFFEHLGWQCLIVEPMPAFCAKIKAARTCDVAEVAASDKAGDVQFHIATGVETLSTIERDAEHFARIGRLSKEEIQTITVKTARLDDILLARGISTVDFLTIDVEGHELAVLSGMAFTQICPRIIIIEDNTHGVDRSIKNLLQSKSYVRFKKTGCNDWYAKNDDVLVTPWSRFSTEVPIFLYVVKQYIKPFAPSWMRRKVE